MNVLVEDLAYPAATVMQHMLNKLPPTARARVADACASGNKLELRMREGEPTLVALWVVAPEDGRGVELCLYG